MRGEGTVTAADIICPAEVEIINPDLYLFTVDNDKAKLEIEMTVQRGRGYSPAEERARLPIGEVPVDAIYKLRPPQLSADAAWLAALCFSLQLYFQFSGYADIAIGLGRMLGLRYPENFHRPYLADSVREFWRRWHVTSITWLRDYLAFPIAGRDAPTLRLFPSILIAFLLLGLWYGGGWTVTLWAVYSGAFLAFEAVGFGATISRWPTSLPDRRTTCARAPARQGER